MTQGIGSEDEPWLGGRGRSRLARVRGKLDTTQEGHGALQPAGRSCLLVILTHAAYDQIKAMIANVKKGLDTVMATAPQLTKVERWKALMRCIIDKIITARQQAPRPA